MEVTQQTATKATRFILGVAAIQIAVWYSMLGHPALAGVSAVMFSAVLAADVSPAERITAAFAR